MKYSGIEWIGEIPDKWTIKSVRECLFERNEKNDKLEENTILSLSAKDGVTLYDGENHSGNKPKEDLSGYKIVKENDIVANSMNILSGSVGLSQYNGVVSPVYYIYHIRNSKDSIRYFSYIFQCNEFQKNLRRLGKGILIRETEDGKLNTIRTKVPAYQLSIEKLPYPDEKTQQKIVNVLDKKTFDIDLLIKIENQQIEKLKEYKQAVITETVTKGLNRNVSMKYSGVEWIGYIPAHWSFFKTKRITKDHLQGYYDSTGYSNFGFRLLRITDLESDGNYTIHNAPFVKATEGIEKFTLKQGDFCFARTGGAGLFCYITNLSEPAVFASYLIRFRFEKQNNNFLKYVFLSNGFQEEIRTLIHGSVNSNVHAENILETRIALPPLSEQTLIADYLDNKCSDVNSLISIKQDKIDKLERYKKTLVYEYVTGKKEVC